MLDVSGSEAVERRSPEDVGRKEAVNDSIFLQIKRQKL
jgi:hypothetical protein